MRVWEGIYAAGWTFVGSAVTLILVHVMGVCP